MAASTAKYDEFLAALEPAGPSLVRSVTVGSTEFLPAEDAGPPAVMSREGAVSSWLATHFATSGQQPMVVLTRLQSPGQVFDTRLAWAAITLEEGIVASGPPRPPSPRRAGLTLQVVLLDAATGEFLMAVQQGDSW